MSLQINDVAPDFEAETTEGRIRFHDWIGDSWAVLFSHPNALVVAGRDAVLSYDHARWKEHLRAYDRGCGTMRI